MNDVRLSGSGSHPVRELAPREPSERPRETEQTRPQPRPLGLDVDDLDPFRGIAGHGPLLACGEHPEVDAVLAEPADQRQGTAARGASFRERRLRQDEQRPHAASASR